MTGQASSGVTLLQQTIWQGSIPLEIHLAIPECRRGHQAEAFLV